MATRTLGSNATTTLQAVPWPNVASASRMADIGTIRNLILDDAPLLWPLGNAGTAQAQNAIQMAAAHPLVPNSITLEGLLFVPNRGVLKILPGDWIGVDPLGWPVLISGRSIQSTGTGWTKTGNPT